MLFFSGNFKTEYLDCPCGYFHLSEDQFMCLWQFLLFCAFCFFLCSTHLCTSSLAPKGASITWISNMAFSMHFNSLPPTREINYLNLCSRRKGFYARSCKLYLCVQVSIHVKCCLSWILMLWEFEITGFI